jgi:hypothetical protein
MTIASADADGAPWASPVWFAHLEHREFIWVSRPSTRHSRNLAERPRMALVIFDSRTPIGTGTAVYCEAVAEEIRNDEEIVRAMAAFNERSLAQGGTGWGPGDVSGDAELRPYRAVVTRSFIGINDRRTEVDLQSE